MLSPELLSKINLAGLVLDFVAALVILTPDVNVLQKLFLINSRVNAVKDARAELFGESYDLDEEDLDPGLADLEHSDRAAITKAVRMINRLKGQPSDESISNTGQDRELTPEHQGFNYVINIIRRNQSIPFEPDKIIVTGADSKTERVINIIIDNGVVADRDEISAGMVHTIVQATTIEAGVLFQKDSRTKHVVSKDDLNQWLEDYPRRMLLKIGAGLLAFGFILQILSSILTIAQ